MQKLTIFDEIQYALNNQEILFIKDKKGFTFFAKRMDKVRVYNENSNYIITFDEFQKLFSKTTFYVYEKEEDEFISKQKDDEYYSWWHK